MTSDPRLAARGQPPAPPPPPPPLESAPPTPASGTPGYGGANDVAMSDVTQRDGTSSAESGGDCGGDGGGDKDGDSFKLRFCTVCASNQNRSMEAHLRLSSRFPTLSFGTGSLVRLPGPSISEPNVYRFNSTTYAAIASELAARDPRLYRANGLLNMLSRNAGIKRSPERWQDWAVGAPRVGPAYAADRGHAGTEAGVVDVVVTCEERCWDAVVDDLLSRGAPLNRPVHVFNVDIKDNHEEALVGGKAILDLAVKLNEAAVEEREKAGVQGWDMGSGEARRGFDERVPDILTEWQERWPALPALWTLAWF